MGGGNTQTPLEPIAYRERDMRPLGGIEKGVEVIRTGKVYWAGSTAEALRKAEADGAKIGH